MSESIIADFVAKFNSDRLRRREPVRGRVLLSGKRLVLAVRDDDKLTIPLQSIVDIGVGQVPEELGGFFDSTVTVVFRRDDSQFVATIEGEADTIEKFSTVLFKVILNGTETTIKHPALVGGRVTSQEFVRARLLLKPGVVQFKTTDETVDIRLAAVTQFRRATHEIAGARRPVLEVRHMPRGQSMLTIAALDSPRKMSVLGRYLRLEYSELMADIRNLDLSTGEKELLVALYSGAGTASTSLAQIVDEDASRVTMLLNRLEAEDLVVDADGGTTLTPKGRVVVNRNLEDVNQ